MLCHALVIVQEGCRTGAPGVGRRYRLSIHSKTLIEGVSLKIIINILLKLRNTEMCQIEFTRDF